MKRSTLELLIGIFISGGGGGGGGGSNSVPLWCDELHIVHVGFPRHTGTNYRFYGHSVTFIVCTLSVQK